MRILDICARAYTNMSHRTQRGAAPAGHNADRVDVDACDRVGDVGSRCAPAGLEEDVEGHLRSAPCQQAASRAGSRRSRVSERRVQTARVRGGGWGTAGDNAAQAAAGHSQAHQLTCYDREALQIAKKDSTSIALATNSTDSRDRPERQADVVGDEVARGGISPLSSPVHRACTRVDE